jgi:hypothetical protein
MKANKRNEIHRSVWDRVRGRVRDRVCVGVRARVWDRVRDRVSVRVRVGVNERLKKEYPE